MNPELPVLAPVPERRRPSRGEERRAALLAALRTLLDSRPLADVSVEDIAQDAGVTRSAFYFYFPTKAAAVAAILRGVFNDMIAATSDFFEREHGTPRERLRDSLSRGAAAWLKHGTLLVALLDAAGSDPDIRKVLDQWVDAYAELTAERIEAERKSGRAPDGVDARSLARVLIGMNQRAFERDLRDGASERQVRRTVAALVDVWACTVYHDTA
jgi:AcrR family transcriptional regulator